MTPSLRLALSAVALGLAATLPAHAKTLTQSGSLDGMSWTATKTLTGVFNTGNAANPAGNALYHPSYPQYSGAVHLLMDYGPGGAFICSGTLLSDRRSVLTAGHCVSDGAGTANPLTTTVYFQPPAGIAPGTRIQTGGVAAPGATAIGVSRYIVNSGYTGDVIDQNDIAILTLADWAPSWAQGYGLHTDPLQSGQDMTVTGYGNLGSGATGTSGFSARLRTGENTYDYRLGDALFGNGWANVLGEPFAQIAHSWVSDFDNGLNANDTSCRVARASNLAGAAGQVFCDTGVGNREVGVAGGDSGGGAFINGRLSSVNSYGLTFGTAWGDSLPGLNSSFGEFSGYVPVYLHADWIKANLVPAPSSFALIGLGLLAAAGARRRRAPQA